MCNTRVTVDTGFALIDGSTVFLSSTAILFTQVHAFEVVAIAAFARVRGLHRIPHAVCQFPAVLIVFFRCIDLSGCLVPEFPGRLDLAYHLVSPGPWYMTVSTGDLNT